MYTGFFYKDPLVFLSLSMLLEREGAWVSWLPLLYFWVALFWIPACQKVPIVRFRIFHSICEIQSSKIGLAATFLLHEGQKNEFKNNHIICAFRKLLVQFFLLYPHIPKFSKMHIPTLLSSWLFQAVCIVLKSPCGKFTALWDGAKNLIVPFFLGKSEDCVRHACFDSYGWHRPRPIPACFNIKTNSFPLKQGYFSARFKKSETAEILMLDFGLLQLETSIIHI